MSQKADFFPVFDTVCKTASGWTLPFTVTFCSFISTSNDSTPAKKTESEFMLLTFKDTIETCLYKFEAKEVRKHEIENPYRGIYMLWYDKWDEKTVGLKHFERQNITSNSYD